MLSQSMYTRQEASKLKEEFWTTLGKYISPVPSAEGLRINWVNYKTGIKDVKFFMEADANSSVVGIKLLHADPNIQLLFYKEFEKLRSKLEQCTTEKWQWQLHQLDEFGKIYTTIFKQHLSVNLYDKAQWPEIISFLKARIIALDKFWSEWKYSFEDLI